MAEPTIRIAEPRASRPNPGLVIAISSRALFDMSDSDIVFEREGVEGFSRHQIEHENDILEPGPAYHVVKKLLALNEGLPSPVIDVALLSRNSPDAGLRVARSIEAHNLAIERVIFTNGSPRFQYASALGAHLFLSREPADVRKALEAGIAAATMLTATEAHGIHPELRIAFDGDAVIFSDEAERVYKARGLTAFQEHERTNAAIPLGEGPFSRVLKTIDSLQHQHPELRSKIRIALVTSRGLGAHERVFRTLRAWGIQLDEVAFVSGVGKGRFLKAFGADIAFDDQARNLDPSLESTASCHVPAGVANEVSLHEEAAETPRRRLRP
jgi:5'-nucleotidase